ncbi:conserved hypothetical protein [Planktothrix serta PCC 8927]|uniref:Uncharacterized protein n=1 Tax=Planktothrix serta PCC 8927 TaxID=671068 RepID=A0A7Z9DX02_9CYAN|nr:hypothetical protein [Planktothrix serta]VXD13547.1 conserved hypothetical protein [Planktothrix serta PCC 8927]
MTPIEFFSPIFSAANLPPVLSQLDAFPSISSNWLFLVVVVILVLLVYFLNKNQVKAVQNISEQALQIQSKVIDQVQDQTTEMAAIAQEKINLILEEYQKFLPYAEQLGLKVDSFSIEAGVLPQIKTSLRGSIDNIKNEMIEKIKSENNNNKLLIAVLNAILLAKKCNDKLESVYISLFKDIIIDIKLGIPPAISVRFQ